MATPKFRLFATGQSFAFETVMSHPSKIDLLSLAKTSGYKTYFYFVFADDLNTNLARVKLRAIAGGHDVDESLTTGRAPRVFKLFPNAFKAADTAYVIDNSNEAEIILMKENNILYKKNKFPKIIEASIKKAVSLFSGTVKNI